MLRAGLIAFGVEASRQKILKQRSLEPDPFSFFSPLPSLFPLVTQDILWVSWNTDGYIISLPVNLLLRKFTPNLETRQNKNYVSFQCLT